MMAFPDFSPKSTPNGELPPWEIANAFALHCVLARAAETLDTAAHELVYGRVNDYIARHLTLQGGAHPNALCSMSLLVGILLDGVGDLQMIADFRETLQARAKEDTGGVSPTMVYADVFTLFRRAVVETMAEAAKNLGLLESHHWLADRRNVLPFRLNESAFAQP